jgi:predicted nucleotide-binding protein
MFEQPTKNDLDRTLSLLMHDSRHQLMAEVNRIKGDAIKLGALQSSRVVVTAIKAADDIHKAAVGQAQSILLDFIQRMQCPPSEIVAWARPHLENLGNSVLGVVPPNNFPQDHQRLIHQYRAVFQQRLDGMLRDVEIGFVKGAGFARAEEMVSKEKWIRAAEAVRLLKPAFGIYDAQMTICVRAHSGMIRARAARLIIDSEAADNVEVPQRFWWAEGHEALKQNWTAGDFETRVDFDVLAGKPQRSGGKVHLQAFGVSFLQADIEKLIPPEANLDTQAKPAQDAPARKVFVVHGHDEGVREAVARFVEKLGLETVILHEQANQGRTVIEKVEAHSDVGFAIVLLTPDDEGCVKGGAPQPRARQNVLLELGYFLGKLTRKRVCTLKVGEVEIPSDWSGVVDEPFNSGGGWKQSLARELTAAGYDIDWKKVMMS